MCLIKPFVSGDESINNVTYEELLQSVESMTQELKAIGNEIKCNEPLLVLIVCPMTAGLVTSVLGILESNAYFYISPEFLTSDYASNILSCITADVVLIESSICSDVPFLLDAIHWKTLNIHDTKFKLFHWRTRRFCSPLPEHSDLAYIVTTTGSTGDPKLVFVPWSCCSPNVSDFRDIFKLTEHDVIFSAAPLSFDPSIINILMSIYSKARLVVSTSKIIASSKIVDIIFRLNVSVIQMTPSLLILWNNQLSLNSNILSTKSKLRVLALGGEHLPFVAIRSLLLHCQHLDLYNLYGITEVSSWSTVKQILFSEVADEVETTNRATSSSCVSYSNIFSSNVNIHDIGNNLSNSSLCVVNNDGSVISCEGEGEIYLGRRDSCITMSIEKEIISSSESALFKLNAISVSKTYNNMPMYPSGDIGFVRNGSVFYKGRKSRIVKCYGTKVNLDQLERLCAAERGVASCRVVSNISQVLCFIVSHSNDVVEKTTIQSIFRKCTVIPCRVVFVSHFPLNAHGKIDDASLMKNHYSQSSELLNRPDALTDIVKSLWFEFFSVHPTTFMNFVSCGGESLRAVEFLEIVGRRTGLNCLGELDTLLSKDFGLLLERLNNIIDVSSDTNFSKTTVVGGVSDPPYKKRRFSSDNLANVIISRWGFIRHGLKQALHDAFLPKTNDLLWSYNLGKCIDASPIISAKNCLDLSLFIGSHSSVFCCLDALTGVPRWSTSLAGRMEASPSLNASASQVYCGCYSGFLYCFSSSSGDLLWKYSAASEIKCSPIVDQITGNVYFGSHDKHFYCLDESGNRMWQEIVSGASIFASPCIHEERVFVACLKGTVTCFHKLSGKRLWRRCFNAPVFASLVCFSKGILCVSVDKQIRALSYDGGLIWHSKLLDLCYCTPSVFILPDDEVICLGDNCGNIYLFNSEGKLLCRDVFKCRIMATPFLYSVADNLTAVVATTDGTIYFLKLSQTAIDFTNTSNFSDNLHRSEVSNKETNSSLHVNKNSTIDITGIVDHKSHFAHSVHNKLIVHVSSAEKHNREFCGVRDENLKVVKSEDFPWRSEWIYKISYPGEIFSSPLLYSSHLYICGREDTVHCYKLKPMS